MSKQAQAKYDAKNTRKFTIKLNRNTDADLINYLEAQPAIQAAIKEALREKIKKGHSERHSPIGTK